MTDDAALAEAPDPAVLRAELRLQVLQEVVQIGMRVARALERVTLAAAEAVDPAATPDAAEAPDSRAPSPVTIAFGASAALDRISRSVRLTVALEARAEEQLRALLAGEAAEVEARRVAQRKRAADEAAAQSRRRRDTVEVLVVEAAEREVEDEGALWGVMGALEQRLDEDEAYQDLEQAPLRETVERLCIDLELTPDWSLWEGEGWTPRPPFSRPRFSPWSHPSRTPLRPCETASPNARRLE
ncbi:MAG TPA: hypothetical protein VGG92_12035 [Caulobacteraceae bacterium]|jgi:hypothetical protein